jgi:hypothetical protein
MRQNSGKRTWHNWHCSSNCLNSRYSRGLYTRIDVFIVDIDLYTKYFVHWSISWWTSKSWMISRVYSIGTVRVSSRIESMIFSYTKCPYDNSHVHRHSYTSFRLDLVCCWHDDIIVLDCCSFPSIDTYDVYDDVTMDTQCISTRI